MLDDLLTNKRALEETRRTGGDTLAEVDENLIADHHDGSSEIGRSHLDHIGGSCIRDKRAEVNRCVGRGVAVAVHIHSRERGTTGGPPAIAFVLVGSERAVSARCTSRGWLQLDVVDVEPLGSVASSSAVANGAERFSSVVAVCSSDTSYTGAWRWVGCEEVAAFSRQDILPLCD